MSAVSVINTQQIIDKYIDPILDETYIHLNHIKMIVTILLYIFSLRVVGERLFSFKVWELKNEIIKLRKKGNILTNDFDEIKMIIDFSQFICIDYVGIYHFIDEKNIKISETTNPSQSNVKYILYNMIKIFIYDRELLFPFTNHTEDKYSYLKKYGYNNVTEKEDYTTFKKFKDNFIDQFWNLFNYLDKLIDDFKLNVLFKIKYSFLYELTDIVVNCMFSNSNYSNHYNFTEQQCDERTLLNIGKSYYKYNDIIQKYINYTKEINTNLQNKLTNLNMKLKSMDITIETINKIAENVNKCIELIDKLSELSKSINIGFHNHIKIILKTSTLTEDNIDDHFSPDNVNYLDSLYVLEREIDKIDEINFNGDGELMI